MAHHTKLTWQPGSNGRKGRWSKKYRLRVFRAPGGGGPNDREAYRDAVEAFAVWRAKVDSELAEPLLNSYAKLITEWESVLEWSRTHDEQQMVGVAEVKLKRLRQRSSSTAPPQISNGDSLAGYFTVEGRFPGAKAAMEKAAELAEIQVASEPVSPVAGVQQLGATVADTMIRPADYPSLLRDPFEIDRRVWQDRIQRDAPPVNVDDTISAHVDAFMRGKRQEADSGTITFGRVHRLESYLRAFSDHVGGSKPAEWITSTRLLDYRSSLLTEITAKRMAASTAKERLSSIVMFVRWLYETESLPSLPRILDRRGGQLAIDVPAPESIVIFSSEEIATLIVKATERTRLYLLLTLNTGMTQQDISDLTWSEFEPTSGRITRQRSKTRGRHKVPRVSYLLWPETLTLLNKFATTEHEGRVLVNSNGSPIVSESMDGNGKLKKSDAVRNAFKRLAEKCELSKSFKNLKKTSASLLNDQGEYHGIVGHFLGHSPGTMAEKHYAAPPQELFDKGVAWLGDYYRGKGCFKLESDVAENEVAENVECDGDEE